MVCSKAVTLETRSVLDNDNMQSQTQVPVERYQSGSHFSTASAQAAMWSTDALKAMETHLNLLAKETRRKQTQRKIANSSDLEKNYNTDCSDSDDTSAAQALIHTYNNDDCRSVGNLTNTLVEVNSQSPLPNGWEQFLD
eukprot:c24119_g1_i1 orf=1-414(-)